MNPASRRLAWHDPNFRLLWLGAACSMAGAQITLVVLPVLVFQLTGSPARTALLLSIQAIPYLLCGLLAGAVADRVDRRRLMVGCDLASAAAVIALPVAELVGNLTLTQIYVTSMVTATTFVWRDAAAFGALPAIVGREQLVPAMSTLTATWTILQVTAPALAGVLIATIGPVQALWCEVAGYLAAAITLLLIRRSFGGAGGGPTGALGAEIVEGLRFVRRHPVIWPLSVMGFGLSFTGGAVMGLLVVYGVDALHLDDQDPRLAWLYSAIAVGGLVAAFLVPSLVRRVGQPRLDLSARGLAVLILVPVALVSDLWVALVALACWFGAQQIAIIGSIALRQQLTPDRLQARVNATGRMIAWGGQPFGAAVGGLLAEILDIRVALLLSASGALMAVAWGAARGLRGVNQHTISGMLERAALS